MSDARVGELLNWIESVSGTEWIWYAKYVAANDTYAKPNVHQGGPYLAKELLRVVFPRLGFRSASEQNPALTIPVALDSHGLRRDIRVVYYNSKVLGQHNGRDEARMTRWGGRDFPLLAEEATGSLVVFAFRWVPTEDADACRIWLCETPDEEDTILDQTGPVEPGVGLLYSPVGALHPLLQEEDVDRPCTLDVDELPEEWRIRFPTGEAIIEEVVARLPGVARMRADRRLLRRRDCEYELYRSIERLLVMPRIREGFGSVDIFVDFANAVTNRRKARAGRSLELHTRRIFVEENLPHSHGKATEGKRVPDFVFPSIDHYHDLHWDSRRLRMLAAKTTCKDRWRQILNEASRISTKHLLTVQEGVSVTQFREMVESGVQLVVPAPLIATYPAEVQGELVSCERFISETRAQCA